MRTVFFLSFFLFFLGGGLFCQVKKSFPDACSTLKFLLWDHYQSVVKNPFPACSSIKMLRTFLQLLLNAFWHNVTIVSSPATIFTEGNNISPRRKLVTSAAMGVKLESHICFLRKVRMIQSQRLSLPERALFMTPLLISSWNRLKVTCGVLSLTFGCKQI